MDFATRLDDQAVTIAALQEQIANADQRLIDSVAVPDDASRALVLNHRAQLEKNPRLIPAEDALDTIVRLENTLKMEAHRNVTRTKEIGNQRAYLASKRKVLDDLNSKLQEMKAKSGWDGKDTPAAEMDELRLRIDEMGALIATMTDEHKAAVVLNRKKEALIVTLQQELDLKKQLQERLNLIYNDIRVKDRESQELDAKRSALEQEDKQRDAAIAAAQAQRDVAALESVADDNRYLAREIQKLRQARAEQDHILSEQRTRTDILTKRLEIVASAMRDLRLEGVVARPSSSLVPAGEDNSTEVAVELYELLHRGAGALRDTLARKDILYVEKHSVCQELQERLERIKNELDVCVAQQEAAKAEKENEVRALTKQLQDYHVTCRREMDEIVNANLKLKKQATAGKKN